MYNKTYAKMLTNVVAGVKKTAAGTRDKDNGVLVTSYAPSLVNSRPSRPLYKNKYDASEYNNLEPVYRTIYNHTQGTPEFKIVGYQPRYSTLGGKAPNKNYTIDGVQQGQTALITFTGAGGGSSVDPSKENLVEQDHEYAFRYSDIDQAEKLARDLFGKGARVKIIGHSRGGGAADTLGYRLQQAGYKPEVHLVDPVNTSIFQWRNKEPKTVGAYVYVPSNPDVFSKDGFSWSNFVAKFGGRYKTPENAITYPGTHTEGTEYPHAYSALYDLDKLQNPREVLARSINESATRPVTTTASMNMQPRYTYNLTRGH